MLHDNLRKATNVSQIRSAGIISRSITYVRIVAVPKLRVHCRCVQLMMSDSVQDNWALFKELYQMLEEGQRKFQEWITKLQQYRDKGYHFRWRTIFTTEGLERLPVVLDTQGVIVEVIPTEVLDTLFLYGHVSLVISQDKEGCWRLTAD